VVLKLQHNIQKVLCETHVWWTFDSWDSMWWPLGTIEDPVTNGRLAIAGPCLAHTSHLDDILSKLYGLRSSQLSWEFCITGGTCSATTQLSWGHCIAWVTCGGSRARGRHCPVFLLIPPVTQQMTWAQCWKSQRVPQSMSTCVKLQGYHEVNISFILWNHLISWAQNFAVWRHWTCSWTPELVDFKLYAILLRLRNISLGSKICRWPYQQNKQN